MSDDAAPVSIGIVGAGPWVQMVYGGLLRGGSTSIAGIWARRPEAAEAVSNGAPTFTGDAGLSALVEASDAVLFAVPPAVQAELALVAVAAGKPVLLEKPIAADLAGAERLAAAVAGAGVASMVTLTWRYAAETRAFVDACRAGTPLIGQGRFVSGALLGTSPFATPWRLERGALLDVGPHLLDVMDASLGTITSLHAAGSLGGTIVLSLEHEGGATSQALLSVTTPGSWTGVEALVQADDGTSTLQRLDSSTAVGIEAFQTWKAEAVALVRGTLDGDVLDVQRGLHLQRLLHDAEAQLS